MRIFASSLRKLSRRVATWVTFGLLVGLLVLILIAVSASVDKNGAQTGRLAAALSLVTFPGAYDAIGSFLLGLGGLFAVIYGAAIAGSEWSWGTLKNAVARGESRSRYTLWSFAAIALVMGIGLVLAFVIGVIAALIGANIAGVSTSGVSDAATLQRLPELFVRGWLAIIELGALGYAIATLARSQLAGIGAGIALYFGGAFAGIFLPDIVKYLPFAVATSAVSSGSGSGPSFGGEATPASLDPNTALILVIVWMVASLLVAAVFTERAEISG